VVTVHKLTKIYPTGARKHYVSVVDDCDGFTILSSSVLIECPDDENAETIVQTINELSHAPRSNDVEVREGEEPQ